MTKNRGLSVNMRSPGDKDLLESEIIFRTEKNDIPKKCGMDGK